MNDNDNTHVFVSYSRLESKFALKLANDLKNQGVKIWVDLLDGNIEVGHDWREQIEAAITQETCLGMVSVVSPAYFESTYCKSELRRASRLGIPVFPVVLEEIPPEKLSLDLEGIQYIDFRGWEDSSLYQKSLGTLFKQIKAIDTSLITEIPDLETRYLNDLIINLETKKGVLEIEYVDLAASSDSDEPDWRPSPSQQEEWADGFSVLMSKRSTSTLEVSEKAVPKTAPSNILDVVNQHPHFVMIGDPGAGKSTTLRHLALSLARKRLTNRRAKLPVLISLPEWTNEATFEEFLRNKWPFESDALSAVYSDNVALFLDGLNEMGGDRDIKATRLKTWINNGRLPKQLIITCRQDDYIGQLVLGIPSVVVEQMDNRLIHTFVKKYLPEKSDQFLSLILPKNGDVDESQSLHTTYLSRLARNPYMLAALVFIFMNDPDNKLPQNMGTLSENLVFALWERERQRNVQGWRLYEDMRDGLSELAFAMIDRNLSVDIDKGDALRFVQDEELLTAIEKAKIIDINNGRVRFYHQLMQEYFAAVKMKQVDILDHISKTTFVLGKRVPSRWDQVAIALCGIVEDPDAIIDELLERDVFLAVQCINNSESVHDDTLVKLMKRLLVLMRDRSRRYNRVAEQSLKSIGGRALPSLLFLLMDSPDKDKRSAVLHGIGIICDDPVVASVVGWIYQPTSGNDAWQAIDRLATIDNPYVNAILIHVFRHLSGQPVLHSARILQSRGWQPRSSRDKLRFFVATENAFATMGLMSAGVDIVPELITLACDRDPANLKSSMWAIQILGNIDDKRVMPAIVEASHTKNETKLGATIEVLNRIDHSDAEARLLQLFNQRIGGKIGLRIATILKTKGVEPETHEDKIRFYNYLLHHKDPQIGVEAINWLSTVQDKSLVKIPPDFLFHKSPQIQSATMKALSGAHHVDLLTFLLSRLRSENKALAKKYLRMFVGDIDPNILNKIEQGGNVTPTDLYEMLANSKSPYVIPLLIKGLSNKEWLIRMHSAKALRNFRGNRAVDASVINKLVDLVTDSQYQVCVEAAQTLAKIKPESSEVVQALAKSLYKSPIPKMIVYTLKQIGTPEAFEAVDRYERNPR